MNTTSTLSSWASTLRRVSLATELLMDDGLWRCHAWLWERLVRKNWTYHRAQKMWGRFVFSKSKNNKSYLCIQRWLVSSMLTSPSRPKKLSIQMLHAYACPQLHQPSSEMAHCWPDQANVTPSYASRCSVLKATLVPSVSWMPRLALRASRAESPIVPCSSTYPILDSRNPSSSLLYTVLRKMG